MSEVPKPGSIGRPVPGVQVRLVEPTGRPDAREVDEDDTGEVTVRGSNLFSGYWPDGADGPDADGWWFTGDLAYADPHGDLYLVDRRRELIMVSGFNVYPREVELALSSHPGVAEAAVIGIPHPYTGEAVKALIVVRPGFELTPAEIQGHAATHLSKFKCPTTVEFVETLPHTATGKVRKGSLRAVPDQPSQGGETATAQHG
jgi:long-chain acyl-CoA synthetase